MFCVEWDDSLSVGVAQIDDQHKHLVGLLNKTYNACIRTDMEDELKYILNELVDYSRNHLASEEHVMERYDYPEVGLQKIEHGMFSEKIMHIHQELYETERNPAITLIEVARLLGNWLTNHIMKIDRRFGKYVAALEQAHDETHPCALSS